jgi:hypothetical protein
MEHDCSGYYKRQESTDSLCAVVFSLLFVLSYFCALVSEYYCV